MSNEIDDPLCELFPTSVGVRIGLVGANRQASIQHKNTTVCPLREETSSVRRWLERGVVLLESDVHVLERRRGRSRRSNRECQPVGLVIVVIRVLTHDYNLDIAEGSVTGPVDNVLEIIRLYRTHFVLTMSRCRFEVGTLCDLKNIPVPGIASDLGTPCPRDHPSNVQDSFRRECQSQVAKAPFAPA